MQFASWARRGAAAVAVLVAATAGAVVTTGPAQAAGPCLTARDLTNPQLVHTAVNWGGGVADVVTARPLCPGVQLRGSGAAYAFQVGSTPSGHGHPNVPVWPQTRTAVTPWQALPAGAGHHQFQFPRVVDQCTQTDVAIWTQGWVAGWPGALGRPGAPQPHEVAYWVGNGRGCFPAPRVGVTVKCRAGVCDGTANTTFAIMNPGRYATITGLKLAVDGHAVFTHSVRVRPGASQRITVTGVKDGKHTWRVDYQLVFGRTASGAVQGGFEVRCPPAAHVTVTVECLACRPLETGRISDANSSRYGHVVRVLAGKQVLASVVVPAGKAGTVTATWPKTQLVSIEVAYQLAGQTVRREVVGTV